MKYKQLLLMLFLTGYTGAAFSEDSPRSENNETPLIVPAEKLKNIEVSIEEAVYILAECEQFAADDAIEAEFVSDYIKVCSHELTQAVKTAKYRRQKKANKPPPSKGSSQARTKPPNLL